MLEKIVSGGQTGVDRGALDAALAAGFPCGGWCPGGRRAEDGVIAARYPLEETESARYPVRTRRNVEDSDGTLIVARVPLTGGTKITADFARRLGKPLLIVDPDRGTEPTAVAALSEWIAVHRIGTLNVAGPRASTDPEAGIAAQALIAGLVAGLVSGP